MRLGLAMTAILSFLLGAGVAVGVTTWRARHRPGAPDATALETTGPVRTVVAPPADLPRLSAPLTQPTPSSEDAELTRRAEASGSVVLDPSFSSYMIPKLGEALTLLTRAKRGQLLELSCRARSCVARLQWPPEIDAQGRDADPLTFAPDEPGCTREMVPSRAEQLAASGAPVRVSFYYQCNKWIQQLMNTEETRQQPSAEAESAQAESDPAASPEAK
jgi:hypothetical protein